MTAVKDPLYREIEKRLSERLDPMLFERCAVKLLRPVYPGLVPVSGGDDAGMDGAISQPTGGPPVPLVCTTARDVIGNLTESLESYVRSGQKSREAVLATSRALTPRQRRNLENRAREKGFELRNVHDRDDFTGRLYRKPDWRKELLGLTGDLPALSAYPRLHRPRLRHDGRPLVGRDEDASWVRSQRDNFVLVGQPGVGKRSLLRLLVEDGRGLFVVTNDMARIADDYRAEQPEFLLLADAHLPAEDPYRSDLLSAICRMWEIGASFKIAATTWTWPDRRVAHEIGSDVATKTIHPLSRPDTAKIVSSVAPKLPENDVAEIVDQSECRPGLAVTLAEHDGAPGAAGRLADGRALLAHIRRSCTSRGLTGLGLDVLAAFALAGSTGAALAKVANVLGKAEVDIRATLSKVAPTGILKDGDHFLAIVGPALRAALVARTFFRGPSSLSAPEHLAVMPDPRSATLTLIDALDRGASVPHELIQRRLPKDPTHGPDQELWQRYARTGSEAVKWIVQQRPHQLPIVALSALRISPRIVLSKLLSAMSDQDECGPLTEDERTPSPARHGNLLASWETPPAISAIQDWIQQPTPDIVRRRRMLLDALSSSCKGSHEASKGLRQATVSLVRSVFSLDLRGFDPDPIELGTVRFDIRGLLPDHVVQIHALWKPSTDLLRKVNEIDTARQIAQSWATAPWRPGSVLPPETVKVVQEFAARMITDVVRWSEDRPGIVLWAKQLAVKYNLHIPYLPETPPDLEALFGIRPDHSTRDQQDRAARLVAEKLASQPAAVGVNQLLRYEEEARVTLRECVALGTVEKVVRHIAERTQDPSTWVTVLASRQASVHWMARFVDAMLVTDRGGEEEWRALLDHNEYRDVVVQSAICQPRVPESVAALVLNRLGGYMAVPDGINWKDVPDWGKERILAHENRQVAVAVACEIHRQYQDHDPALATLSRTARRSWRRAIVESDDEVVLAGVFRHHPDVAKAWLLSPDRRLPDRAGEASAGDIVDEMLNELRRLEKTASPTLYETAANALNSDAKLQLIRAMSADTDPGAFLALVGNDPTLYEALLSRRDLERMHLTPLVHGAPSPDLAELAVSHGYSPKDVAERIVTWPELFSVFSHFPEFKTVEEMRDPRREWLPDPPAIARHDAMAEWKRHPSPVVRQIYGLVMEMET